MAKQEKWHRKLSQKVCPYELIQSISHRTNSCHRQNTEKTGESRYRSIPHRLRRLRSLALVRGDTHKQQSSIIVRAPSANNEALCVASSATRRKWKGANEYTIVARPMNRHTRCVNAVRRCLRRTMALLRSARLIFVHDDVVETH